MTGQSGHVITEQNRRGKNKMRKNRLILLYFFIFIFFGYFSLSISYDIPANYSSIEECFDAINGTTDSCVLGVSDYSETFSPNKYYSFLTTYTLTINTKNNITVDFNGATINQMGGNFFLEGLGWNHYWKNLNVDYMGWYIIEGNPGTEGNWTYDNFLVKYCAGFINFGTGNPDSTIKILNSNISSTEGALAPYASNLIINNTILENLTVYLTFNNVNRTIENSKFLNKAHIDIQGNLENLIIKNSTFEGDGIIYSMAGYFNNSKITNNYFNNCTKTTNQHLISIKEGYNNNIIENNTFNNCGNISFSSIYFIDNSPRTYNGNNYDYTSSAYVHTDTTFTPITTDAFEVTSQVDGTKNGTLCLHNIAGGGIYITVYTFEDETCTTSQAVLEIAYPGTTLDYYEPNVLISHGTFTNYSNNFNSSTTLTATYSDNNLYYQNVTSILNTPIWINGGTNNNITGNTFINSKIPIFNNGTDTKIWNNNFLNYLPTDLTGANYCINQKGNFYEQTLTPMTGDCGPLNITDPEESEIKNSTINITWKKQDSIIQVIYELFIKKIGESFSFLGNTTETNFTFDTLDYFDSDYTFKIVPYIKGSRYNGTVQTRNFSIDNPPKVPVLENPSSEAIIVDRTPSFNWSNSTNSELIVYYNLLVDNNNDFSSPEIDIIVTDMNYTASSDFYFNDYFWKVIANDSIKTSASEVRNFSIITNVGCVLLSDTINFDQINVGQAKNTLSEDALVLRNTGNIKLNVSINATSLWYYFPNPTLFYQYVISENETDSIEGGTLQWTNFSSDMTNSIFGLNYGDLNDEARIDIKIQAPQGEGAGEKSSSINLWCEQDE